MHVESRQATFTPHFEPPPDFLASPCKLWDSGRLEYRGAVLRLTFADRLTFTRNEGLRTAGLAVPFRLLAEISGAEKVMAERVGFEPTNTR